MENNQKDFFKDISLIALLLLLISGVLFFGWIQFKTVASGNETMLASLANSLTNTANAGVSNKPNILLILSDDYGWPYYGFTHPNGFDGHVPVKTPNIDKLANEGITFVNGTNAAPICRPSLQNILTGLNHRDISKLGSGEGIINPNVHALLPQYLESAGYATFQAGKWWQRDAKDYFTESYENLTIGRTTIPGTLNAQGVEEADLTPIYNFIKKYNLDPPEDNKKPFFIWYMPRMPHLPFGGGAPYKYFINKYPKSEGKRDYFAMISWFDSTVGDLINFLEKNNLRNNTLIIYLTDNGFSLPQSKNNFTENGLRTPIILNFSGVIPAVGKKDALVSSIDILPTALEYAGTPVSLPDAMSMKTLAESGGNAPWRKYIFGNWHIKSQRSVRTKQYKLYVNSKPTKLFDLYDNPQEGTNLINDNNYKDKINELTAVLNNWWKNKVHPPLE